MKTRQLQITKKAEIGKQIFIYTNDVRRLHNKLQQVGTKHSKLISNH